MATARVVSGSQPPAHDNGVRGRAGLGADANGSAIRARRQSTKGSVEPALTRPTVWAAERSGDPADAAPREGAGESRSAIPQPDRVVAGQRVGADVACHVGVSNRIERSLTLDTAERFTGGAHHRGERGHGHTATPDSAWAAVLGSNVGSGIRSRPVHEEDRHPRRYAPHNVLGEDSDTRGGGVRGDTLLRHSPTPERSAAVLVERGSDGPHRRRSTWSGTQA